MIQIEQSVSSLSAAEPVVQNMTLAQQEKIATYLQVIIFTSYLHNIEYQA